jgi:hypothetical protein
MSPISTAIPAGTRLGSFAHGESAGSSSKRLRIGPRVGPDPWSRVLSCTVAAYDRATPRQHLRDVGRHDRRQLRIRQRVELLALLQEPFGRELSVVMDTVERAGRWSVVKKAMRPRLPLGALEATKVLR